MKIVCLYPVDETTEFLRPIYSDLAAFPSFTGIELGMDEKEIEEAINTIKACDDDTHIVFLGHGASHCLYKADKSLFIGKTEFPLFHNKRVFLLACRSAEFIERNKSTIPKEYMGFGNMLTDWSEVIAERDADVNAYLGIDEKIITSYKEILTDVISKALVKTLSSNENYRYLYLQIKLLFNKKMTQLLIEKNHSGYKILGNLLYETKTDMIVG